MIELTIFIVILSIIIFILRIPKAVDKNYTGFKKERNKIDINKIRTLLWYVKVNHLHLKEGVFLSQRG